MISQKDVRLSTIPILLYIPVPHNGYLEFFERNLKNSKILWIIGDDLAAKFSSLHTEIRAVPTQILLKWMYSLEIFGGIKVLNCNNVSKFSASKIITAFEDISRQVIAAYFPTAKVVFDTVFLRYDESNVKTLKPVIFDRESIEPFDIEMMQLAYNESDKSTCWWRHVGAVMVKSGKVVTVSHNQHVPSDQTPYIFGDPRDFVEAGTLSHFASSLHGEDGVFAKTMKLGISTLGSDIYVSVFPCPRCAKVIAYSGIKRCFFGSGHASLDGQKVLKSQGVELIYVPIQPHI